MNREPSVVIAGGSLFVSILWERRDEFVTLSKNLI